MCTNEWKKRHRVPHILALVRTEAMPCRGPALKWLLDVKVNSHQEVFQVTCSKQVGLWVSRSFVLHQINLPVISHIMFLF